MKKVIAIVAVVAWAGLVNAATINVPSDQPTIQAGISAAFAGDTVMVSPGTYVENVSFDGKAIVVISSDGPEVTTIQGAASASSLDVPGEVDSSGTSPTDFGTDAISATVRFINSEPKGAVLCGFTITGGNSSGIYCDINSSPTILNNIITGNMGGGNLGGGLSLRGTTGAVVRGNTFYGNSCTYGASIHIGEDYHTNTDDTICYNVMYGNSGYGEIRALGSLINEIIYNNTVIATTWSGLLNQGAGAIIAKNNIVVFGDPYGMQGNFAATYNCTFECATPYTSTPGVGNIYADPLFVDSVNNDYHLDMESPCIDAGDPDAFYDDPDGTRNDMGAFAGFYGALPLALDLSLGEGSWLNVIDNIPTISWSFYDTIGTQVAYEIEVGTDDDWSVAEMWDTGEIYSSEASALYAGVSLQEGVLYYLRIRLYNGTDWGSWLDRTFRLNTPSSVPELIYPIGGEVVDVDGVHLSVNNSTDNEGDPRTYDFEIYNDPGLTTLFDSDIGVSEQESTTLSKFFTGFTLGAQYWWRARSYDGFEYSEWSIPEYFVAEQLTSLYVPTNYPTIQSAIEAALPGDTVWVLPGTYVETINFLGKDIVILSTDGRDVTVIQSSATSSAFDVPRVTDRTSVMSTDGIPTVSFVSGETVTAVHDGFT
ncbi:MAG: hypothetical protein JSV52_12115, partial [Candidatus Zixiibacteriota bacterium]